MTDEYEEINAPPFDVDGDDVTPYRLALETVERRADDVVWLRYRVKPHRKRSSLATLSSR